MLRSFVLSTHFIILIGSLPQRQFNKPFTAFSSLETPQTSFQSFNSPRGNLFSSSTLNGKNAFDTRSFFGSSSSSQKNSFGSSSLEESLGKFSLNGFQNAFGFKSSSRLDFISETRRQTEELKATLRLLARNPTSAKYIDRVFASGDCIKDMEEAIAAIEQGTQLIENAAPQLKDLLDITDKLSRKSNIIEITRVAADVMRELEVLLPKLAPKQAQCGSTSSTAFAALHNVAAVIDDVSRDSSLDLPKTVKLQLRISREIVTAVTNFLAKLKDTTEDLQNICTTDNKYNARAISTIGEMLEDLAELFFNLGDFQSAEKIKEKKPITDKIARLLSSAPSTGAGSLVCNQPGDFRATAAMMEDLAKLLEQFGLENLQKQIGFSGIF